MPRDGSATCSGDGYAAMSTGDWIPFGASIAAIAIGAYRALPYVWSPPAGAPELEAPRWWPYTDRVFHATVRALPALLVFFLVGAILIPLSALRGDGAAWNYAYDACLAVLFVTLAIVVCVALFNRPSVIVPPHLRRRSQRTAAMR
jgi:hypothetical protein